jgi:hypothetical protein
LFSDELVGLEILDPLRGDPPFGRAHVLLLDLPLDCVPPGTSEEPMPERGHRFMITRIGMARSPRRPAFFRLGRLRSQRDRRFGRRYVEAEAFLEVKAHELEVV